MLSAGDGDIRGLVVRNYFGRQNIGVVVSPSDVERATVFVPTHKDGFLRHPAMAVLDPADTWRWTCKYTRVG
jgi:hypothetical protein